MNVNRFKNYDSDVKEAVLAFEQNQDEGGHRYFDEDDMEMVIDYYLETNDLHMLESSVDYAASLFPDSNEIALRRSHLLCARQQYAEALQILTRLENVEPNNCDVLYALGAVYSAMEQPRRAIEYYERATSDGYDLATIYGNIGEEYAKLGISDRAIDCFKKSVQLNPDEERSLDCLGALYEEENRTDDAIAFFQNFVKEHPYSRMAWFCLGAAYYSQQMWEKAIDQFEYAIAIDSKFVDPYIGVSDCYRALHRPVEAVSALRETLPLVEDKSIVFSNIASIYHDANNLDAAIIYYKKAVDEAPYFAEYWAKAASCFLDLGDRSSAMDFVDRAVHLSPQSPYCVSLAAYIHSQCGDDDNAIPLYDRALQLNLDDEGLWIEYADLLMRLSRYDDAIQLLQDGLTHCQQAYFFYVRLAVCYYKTGRRNFLNNALMACAQYKDTYGDDMLFILCPEMQNDIGVMNTLSTN